MMVNFGLNKCFRRLKYPLNLNSVTVALSFTTCGLYGMVLLIIDKLLLNEKDVQQFCILHIWSMEL